jgi:hypothetical protein
VRPIRGDNCYKEFKNEKSLKGIVEREDARGVKRMKVIVNIGGAMRQEKLHFLI